MGRWVDVWVVRVILRIAYSNQKQNTIETVWKIRVCDFPDLTYLILHTFLKVRGINKKKRSKITNEPIWNCFIDNVGVFSKHLKWQPPFCTILVNSVQCGGMEQKDEQEEKG